MLNQILSAFYPILYAILTAIFAFVGNALIKVIPHVIDFVVAHVGLTNYLKTRTIAFDIWNIVEEHFRVNELISDTVQSKITMFDSLIKQKIPGITEEEIYSVRQAIAGELNKDKPLVIKAVEAPTITEVKVEPTA